MAKFLKEKNPDVRIVAIEPEKGHHLSGLKNFQESNKPVILDESLIDKTVRVPDAPAYETAIRLAREESLLVGPSTGAIVWAALQEKLPAGRRGGVHLARQRLQIREPLRSAPGR